LIDFPSQGFYRSTDPARIKIFEQDNSNAIFFSMSNHVYKKIEIVGSSPESIEKAIENALAKANQSIRNMRWFEVVETRGQIEEGKVAHYQVTLKVGFTLD
jgi:flavin-binding protein dodecin